ncbi:uncharacterized protein LACBIDRAFT_300318 [Laccaria bicolor S238N-H82]|uniref:Predicted protein n=1 Tax=Laccaria bicolor (strain S238N-H82 / ATCC MYA-4686) TaxID=486041 RepID=B0DGH4_LACBS|nr:uncharacterized protein LACBIDRAFT_300318 [Laccaria bicolor S238N-H82]EDR06154.1 predicted protein [Laccaria bicolor S238N-H82]|eukprot:XP_001883015.1 predicted protein [Laccaria bicolor S238N-H82]
MAPKAKKATSRKRQTSNADEQPVKRSRCHANDDDDDQEETAADQWADHEDQATKTKGRGGKGGNRGRGQRAAAQKCIPPLSMAIIDDDCHRSGAISIPACHH